MQRCNRNMQWNNLTQDYRILIVCVHAWTINEPHRPRCNAKSPTVQDMFRAIPGLTLLYTSYMYSLVMLFTDDVCSCCYASQSDSDDSFNLTESSIAAAGTAQSKRWVHTNTIVEHLVSRLVSSPLCSEWPPHYKCPTVTHTTTNQSQEQVCTVLTKQDIKSEVPV